MRQDQIQHLLGKQKSPQLNHDVCRELGYNHYDWISKDVDAYFAHIPNRHKVRYEVPETALQTGLDAKEIADLIRDGEAFKTYNDALNDEQGRLVLFNYQIFKSEKSTSGWSVVFSYALITADLPYW